LTKFIDRWTDGFGSTLMRGIIDAINAAGTALEDWLNSIPGVSGIDIARIETPAFAQRYADANVRQGRVAGAPREQPRERVEVVVDTNDDRFDAYVDRRGRLQARQYSDRVSRETGRPRRDPIQ
jgi:hypothetical protein